MEGLILTKENFTDCVDAATGKPIPREGNVVLPETVIYHGEEYKVTEIGRFAFSGCNNLTSINIPDSVTEIGTFSFSGCNNLTSINIPDGVTKIGPHAFRGCSSLVSVSIPDSVTIIGESAFIGCNGLTSVNIPDSVTSIKFRAFSDCSSLVSVSIPDSVTDIEKYAFSGCNSLTSVSIPDSVTKIEGCVLSNCNSLTSVNIPDSVTSIGYGAFIGCNSLMSVSIPDSVKDIGDDFIKKCSDALVISYKGTNITNKTLNIAKEQSDGLPDQKCLDIAKDATDILGDGIYSPVLVSKLCNAEHGGKLEQTVAQIKKDFRTIGFYDIKNSADVKAKEELTALFQADRKSHGIVPKIIDALTIASTELHIPPEQIVKSFEEKKFRNAVMAMRSCNKGNRFCDVEAALFAMNFDVNTVKNVILENPNKDYASVLLCESYKKNDSHLKDLAKWIVSHPDISQDLVKDIVKYRNGINLDAPSNVAAVRAQISKNEAILEINEIEKAYPGFKFADCKCNLPKTGVELGDYKAYIMDAKDPRQVMIGYDTNCCQHLDGEGETAMMYGLANPDAGFFVIEDKTSGKILAQAETWQAVDSQMLVFDNIEFADDRQISQFAPVLAKWCEESPYPDILMGNGYNGMTNDSIRQFGGMIPPVVEEVEQFTGRKPYTDAGRSCSILKNNSIVEPYFQEAYGNYVQEHGALPEIGSFFSEPSEEDLLAFHNKEESPEDAYVMVSGDRLEDMEDEQDMAVQEVAGRCEDAGDSREDYDEIDELL